MRIILLHYIYITNTRLLVLVDCINFWLNFLYQLLFHIIIRIILKYLFFIYIPSTTLIDTGSFIRYYFKSQLKKFINNFHLLEI